MGAYFPGGTPTAEEVSPEPRDRDVFARLYITTFQENCCEDASPCNAKPTRL